MDETITPQEGMNPESEVIEETIEGETIEETPEEVTEVTEETVPKSQFNQVLARAKKAEEALKKSNPQNITNKQTTVSTSTEDMEAMVLKAQGMPSDLLDELKAVAKARGKTLLDSVNDPIFVAIKSQKETETKALKAKLGASKGSGSVKKEKSINSIGLSEEEHKEMWKANRG
jgi:hypothetical protein